MRGRDRKRDGEICGSLAEGFQNGRDCWDKNFNKEFFKHFLMKKKFFKKIILSLQKTHVEI